MTESDECDKSLRIWQTQNVNGKEKISARLTINNQGRIVIPAPMRHALGVKAGDEIIARIDGRRIVLETPDTVLARIRSWFADVPSDVSLVDELIAERRQEAVRDLQD